MYKDESVPVSRSSDTSEYIIMISVVGYISCLLLCNKLLQN